MPEAKITHTDLARGLRTEFWMPAVAPPAFATHLYPPDTKIDVHACIDFTLPCNFVMHFQVWSPGTAQAGKANGQLLLDSWTSQTVTPRDERWCDYYYSWGLSDATDAPGLSQMLLEAATSGFLEDKAMLEAQYQRLRERPDGNKVDLKVDAGPNRMLFLLDRFLREETIAGQDACAAGQPW